jgi:hypothetical protein
MSEQEKSLEEKVMDAINEMEAPDYVFPKRFTRTDYIIVAVCAAISAAALIAGAYIA